MLVNRTGTTKKLSKILVIALITPFTKGLIRTVCYYAVGTALVYVSYLIFGYKYIHGPGIHHLIGFIVLLGGALWAVSSLINLIINKHDKVNLATLLMNIIVVGTIITFFVIDINRNTDSGTTFNQQDIITINKDSASNSASIVNGLGDTLFLKVGDSIIIDQTTDAAK